jgi:hypothetical protein
MEINYKEMTNEQLVNALYASSVVYVPASNFFSVDKKLNVLREEILSRMK